MLDMPALRPFFPRRAGLPRGEAGKRFQEASRREGIEPRLAEAADAQRVGLQFLTPVEGRLPLAHRSGGHLPRDRVGQHIGQHRFHQFLHTALPASGQPLAGTDMGHFMGEDRRDLRGVVGKERADRG